MRIAGAPSAVFSSFLPDIPDRLQIARPRRRWQGRTHRLFALNRGVELIDPEPGGDEVVVDFIASASSQPPHFLTLAAA
jgi:hypothetical protein